MNHLDLGFAVCSRGGGPEVASRPREEISMTQAQLDSAVARTTGESVRTVRSLGFQLQPGPCLDPEPDDLHLAVPCPRCGVARPLPRDRHGPAAMGECLPCDLFFDYRPGDVRVAGMASEGPEEAAA